MLGKESQGRFGGVGNVRVGDRGGALWALYREMRTIEMRENDIGCSCLVVLKFPISWFPLRGAFNVPCLRPFSEGVWTGENPGR